MNALRIWIMMTLMLALGACSGRESNKRTVTTPPPEPATQVIKSDAEWKKQLTSEQYRILREAATEWLSGGRVTLQWPSDSPEDELAAKPGLAKTMLNLVVLASEAIPQGGIVTVLGEGSPDSGKVVVAAAGRGVKWPPELAVALSGRLSAGAIGPRTIHAAITGRFAEHYGLSLNWDTSDGEHLALRLTW